MAACTASILIVCYNHEPFIAQALRSALDQQASFSVEIIVADDGSSDGTLDIVRAIQAQHPGRIQVLESAANLGITRNYQRGLAACAGTYIAVLEGDDYWLSEHRLRRMVEFLEAHPECAFVFNRVLLVEPQAERLHQWPVAQPFELRSASDLAKENFIGNFSACVYRANLVRQLPEALYQQHMYDWLFNLTIAGQGAIGYLPQVLSAYRLHATGAYAGLSAEQKVRETLELIPGYDAFLNRRYTDELSRHERWLRLQLRSLELGRLRERNRRNPLIWLYVMLTKVILRLRMKSIR